MDEIVARLLGEIGGSLGWEPPPAAAAVAVAVAVTGRGRLASVFRVTELAVASIGAAGVALARLVADGGAVEVPEVVVDRALAARWFASSFRPVGWDVPPAWDPLAGDYEGTDGWIRLHTNAVRHREAALRVLGVGPDPASVAGAVARRSVGELEGAVVEAGGAAAAMRSSAAWAATAPGRAVAAEPLVHHEPAAPGVGVWRPGIGASQPLAGLRVLDMTRVLAGPVGTRLLAGWGADVLRIDPPGWDERALEPEVTLGKRCARLDLRDADDRRHWWSLLAGADVLVHGYRPGALEALGVGADARAERCPGLVEVTLDAYGWTGPWRGRRGFDSLVQMSTGIAAAGKEAAGAMRPVPLPVQALDQATGYLVAAAVLAGLAERLRTGRGSIRRTSLARTARLLVDQGPAPAGGEDLEPDAAVPADVPEETVWGSVRRLSPPLRVAGAPLVWALGARPLGHDRPTWSAGPAAPSG